MVRRPEPSWAATVFVIVVIVGYFIYSAARLRGAALERTPGPGASSAPAPRASP